MYYKTTFADELIAFLFSCRSTSIRKKILWERMQEKYKISGNTYYQNIFRLKKRGILEDKNGILCLSQKGKIFFQNPYRKITKKPIKNNKILVIFDIPETKKKVREWIRGQIKEWDFEMVQKSVWIGYGPLPSEFTERLKFLKVDNGVKIYNLQQKR
jgi:DNA-binding transcriptional regulator PaaX